MVKRFASILNADASNYSKIIKNIEKDNFDGIHFDIMDGHFVKNFAFNANTIKSLRKISSLLFNIHLEIENSGEFLDMFINASCDIITIHPQTTKQIERDLRYIKTCGVLTSIAIDPEKKVGHNNNHSHQNHNYCLQQHIFVPDV